MRNATQEILSPADRTSFAHLAAGLGGRIGLVVSGLGDGQRVQRLGTISSVQRLVYEQGADCHGDRRRRACRGPARRSARRDRCL